MPNPKPLEIEPDAWCAFCGTPLPEFEDRHPLQRYCGRWCSREANRPDVDPVPERRVECAFCGAEFFTHRTTARFCSRTCCRRHYWRTTPDLRDRTKPPPDPRPCIECGQVFQPRRKDKLYCSTSCGNIHRNKRWRAKG